MIIIIIIIIIMPPHLCTGKGYYSRNKWQWKLQMGNTKSKNEYKRVQTVPEENYQVWQKCEEMS